MTHALFIYGTLMPGLRLEAEMHGARFVGAAQVPGRLVDVGRYPGLLLGEGQVTGEVYEVDDAHLARLDAVEDMVPGHRAASQYWRWRAARPYLTEITAVTSAKSGVSPENPGGQSLITNSPRSECDRPWVMRTSAI